MKRSLCLLAFAACLAGGDNPPRTLYRIEAVAGGAASDEGGPAVAAQMGAIQGIAVDPHGNIYLSDTDHHRVRRVDLRGNVTTVAGTGAAGFGGDGGPAAAAQLNLPYGLAADAAGSVYIADLGNNRVRRIAPDGTISTAASALLAPRNVAVDAAGDLFISEFAGRRVLKWSPGGGLVTVAGGAGATRLDSPAGLAFDGAGALYIADSGSNRVCKLLPGGSMFTVLGGGTPHRLFTPTGVAVDAAGRLYVADGAPLVHVYAASGEWSNLAAQTRSPRDLAAAGGTLYIADGPRVQAADPTGVARVLAGDGYTHVGDGGPAAQALLANPFAVALDAAGSLYIADAGSNRVRKVTASGIIGTLAGTGAAGYEAGLAAAASASLDSPFGVAVDAAGNALIADTGNARVRQVAADGRIRTVAGTGETGAGPDLASPLAAPVGRPRAVCADRAGGFYIVDALNHRVLHATAEAVRVVAGSGSGGCALDAAGNLYIADPLHHRIQRAAPDGALASVAGTGEAGFSGDGGPATAAQLNSPDGVAVDGDGAIFLADTGNHRIRRITPAGLIYTIAGSGNPGLAGDGGPAAAARLNAPAGLALDGAGNLYFADSGNHRVRRLVPDGAAPADPVEPPPVISVVNAASGEAGPVAPGELVTILSPGAEASFDGVAAPVIAAAPGQISVQVPPGAVVGSTVHVEAGSGSEDVGVVEAAPALFPAVLNQDGALNSEANPAARGDIVVLYATGEGRAGLPVSLTIAGMEARLLYAGDAPGLTGLMQINARVPGGFVPPGSATARLKVGTAVSPQVALWLK